MRTWDKVPDRESEELLCKDLNGERIAFRSLAVIGTEGVFSDVTRGKYPLFRWDGGFLLSGGQRVPDGHSSPKAGRSRPEMGNPNMNFAGNMNVDAWRSRQITKRLEARLSAQTQEFIRQHGSDTDEQLRAYVRRKATLLRRMPHPLELPGGVYLSSRLGDWNKLALEFGVRPVSIELGRRVYKRLREQEAELFTQERRARKEEKRQRAWEQAITGDNQQ